MFSTSAESVSYARGPMTITGNRVRSPRSSAARFEQRHRQARLLERLGHDVGGAADIAHPRELRERHRREPHLRRRGHDVRAGPDVGIATVKTPPVVLPARRVPGDRADGRGFHARRRAARRTSKVKVSRSSSPTRRNACGRTAGQPSGSSRPHGAGGGVARPVGQGHGEPMRSGSEQRPDVGGRIELARPPWARRSPAGGPRPGPGR